MDIFSIPINEINATRSIFNTDDSTVKLNNTYQVFGNFSMFTRFNTRTDGPQTLH